MPLLTCACGATCRIPSLLKSRVRCGKCAHVFTPRELVKAVPEPPPAMLDFHLERQPDLHEEMSDEQCPDCRTKLRKDGYCDSCGEYFDDEEEDDDY